MKYSIKVDNFTVLIQYIRQFFVSWISLGYSRVCDCACIESSHICKRHRFPLVRLSVGWFLLCAIRRAHAHTHTHTLRRTFGARGCFASALLGFILGAFECQFRASRVRHSAEY
jgi:hypothetical protein